MRVAILGVGLIGGSIGLALRAHTNVDVRGYDPDASALQAALELGAIDEQARDIATAVAGAQVVFAAAPVGVLARIVSEALVHAPPDCVISDVGSTKLALDRARHDPRFVGGHPIAGSEKASIWNARKDLFRGATWYLMPTPSTDPVLLQRLQGLIERLGAHPQAAAADAHDRIMACVSHLPHVLANVLAQQALAVFEREDADPLANPSLRDATRVAGANTAIWTDIYLANGAALIDAIDEMRGRLDDVREALAKDDAAALMAWNENARMARLALAGEEPADPALDA